MTRVRPNALAWLALSVLVIAIDQWSKHWVLASLPEYTAVPVIDGFWNWYRTYNTGAAFSFLANAGGWQKYFFMLLAFGISGLMAWMRPARRRLHARLRECGAWSRGRDNCRQWASSLRPPCPCP